MRFQYKRNHGWPCDIHRHFHVNPTTYMIRSRHWFRPNIPHTLQNHTVYQTLTEYSPTCFRSHVSSPLVSLQGSDGGNLQVTLKHRDPHIEIDILFPFLALGRLADFPLVKWGMRGSAIEVSCRNKKWLFCLHSRCIGAFVVGWMWRMNFSKVWTAHPTPAIFLQNHVLSHSQNRSCKSAQNRITAAP